MKKHDCNHDHGHTRRQALTGASAGFVAVAAAAAGATTAQAEQAAYSDPAEPALPVTDVVVELSDTALVVTDPQIDFLSPDGVTWGVVGESVTEHNTVENIGHRHDDCDFTALLLPDRPRLEVRRATRKTDARDRHVRP
jgi:biuret amidohydrolase